MIISCSHYLLFSKLFLSLPQIMADKHLYIISGPNGAGKETAIKDNIHFKIIEEYVKR